MYPNKDHIKNIPVPCPNPDCGKRVSPWFIMMHENLGNQKEFIDKYGENIMIVSGCIHCGETCGMTLKKYYYEVALKAMNLALNQTVRD